LRKRTHVITVRLSDEEWKHYQNLLFRFGAGATPSERFRALVCELDIPYATHWDRDEEKVQDDFEDVIEEMEIDVEGSFEEMSEEAQGEFEY
jgi:hypothetical protein